MKKALLALSVVALSASAFAQGNLGLLLFRTGAVQRPDGSTYNVPIWQSNNDTPDGIANEIHNSVGAGTLPGGARIGLFTAGAAANATPFFTSVFGSTAASDEFAVNPASATVGIPGSAPGQTANIIIRVWQGADFATAQATQGQQWREWNYTTLALGGDTGTGTPATPPTLTGWGPQVGGVNNNAGYELNITPVPEPSTIALGVLGIGALALARRRK